MKRYILSMWACLALALPSVCSAAGTDAQELPTIPAQIVEESGGDEGQGKQAMAEGLPDEEFTAWIEAVAGGELSKEQLVTLEKTVLDALAAMSRETTADDGATGTGKGSEAVEASGSTEDATETKNTEASGSNEDAADTKNTEGSGSNEDIDDANSAGATGGSPISDGTAGETAASDGAAGETAAGDGTAGETAAGDGAAGGTAASDGAAAATAANDSAGVASGAAGSDKKQKTDPGELSQYVGMSFQEFLALQPEAVSHDTVVGVKGFSLGGEAQEAGLSGKESDEILTKVNLYGGTEYTLFGITFGMPLSQAEAAAQKAGFSLKSNESGLLVFEAEGAGAAPEGSQLTVYSSDGETVNTVTYDIAPGKYF